MFFHCDRAPACAVHILYTYTSTALARAPVTVRSPAYIYIRVTLKNIIIICMQVRALYCTYINIIHVARG